jgi:hypothetical protein
MEAHPSNAIISRSPLEPTTRRVSLRNAPVSHGYREENFTYVKRLRAGVQISAGRFNNITRGFTPGNIRTFYARGDWLNGGQGFIGFKFNTGTGTQYGRVRIETRLPASRHGIFDCAWGDPGDPVKTAQKAMIPSDLVQASALGSLGDLAAGHVGLQSWRNQRSKAKTSYVER